MITRLKQQPDSNLPQFEIWKSVPFTHPTTIETAVVDSDLKNKVKSDLESFLKSKQYYHRLGRVLKRNYLLCGPSGTGKSSFVAGMAKFLSYNVYDVGLSKVSGDSDLKMLLLQITNKPVIVIEDLNRYLIEKSTAVRREEIAGVVVLRREGFAGRRPKMDKRLGEEAGSFTM